MGMKELIVRKSDGAVLTRLNHGDTVFNSKATDNLWAMANAPEDFISKYITPNVTIQSGANGASINSNINVSFNLPGVKNYSEFMNAARNDPKFTSMIQELALGQVTGKPTVGKNKYKF